MKRRVPQSTRSESRFSMLILAGTILTHHTACMHSPPPPTEANNSKTVRAEPNHGARFSVHRKTSKNKAVYTYKIINNSGYHITAFRIGFDPQRETPELPATPIGWTPNEGLAQDSTTAPHGWTATLITTEETPFVEIEWRSADKTQWSIAPSTTSMDFSVVLPQEVPEYERAHFDVVFSDLVFSNSTRVSARMASSEALAVLPPTPLIPTLQKTSTPSLRNAVASSEEAGIGMASTNTDMGSPGRPCALKAPTQLKDVSAKEFETGDEPSLHEKYRKYLNKDTQDNIECMKNAANLGGGRFHLSSAYRPPTYQQHLYEVWTLHNRLKDEGGPECNELRATMDKEFKHHKLVARPAQRTSAHPQGRAFDATITGLPSTLHVDELAKNCKAIRPWPERDPVHFQPMTKPKTGSN